MHVVVFQERARSGSVFLNAARPNRRAPSRRQAALKRQTEKANSRVVQVVQLGSLLERLSDCRTVPYLRFFLVRNEEVVGSNPIGSTKIKIVQSGEILYGTFLRHSLHFRAKRVV